MSEFIDLPYDIHLTAMENGYGVLFRIKKDDIPKLEKFCIEYRLNN